MFSLIVLVIVGLMYGYFATQNTAITPIMIAGYPITDTPLYLIIGATLLIGLLISWIISLSDWLMAALKLRGKDHEIRDVEKSNEKLSEKIKSLELENARLTGELKKKPTTTQ